MATRWPRATSACASGRARTRIVPLGLMPKGPIITICIRHPSLVASTILIVHKKPGACVTAVDSIMTPSIIASDNDPRMEK